MKGKRFLSVFIALIIFAVFYAPIAFSRSGSLLADKFEKLPLQHNGRIKPLAVFARDTLKSISGKEKWEGKSSFVFFLDHLAKPESFREVSFINIDSAALKKQLNLAVDKRYFSYAELKPSFFVIQSLVQKAQGKKDNQIRATALEQKAQILFGQLTTVGQLSTGELFNVIPPREGTAWASPYVDGSLLTAELPAALEEWNRQAVSYLDEAARKKIDFELLYYKLKPFFFTCLFYLLAFLLLSISSRQASLIFWGETLLLTGFLFHTIGLVLRIYILSRPPVSNMYESILFVSWILVICGGIFSIVKKSHFALTVASLTGLLIMMYGNLLPIDQSLDVLSPVLRSNYWLAIHVMTIVASYGIFALAMALAHRHLYCDVFKKFSRDGEKISTQIIVRLLQIGIIALGAGTVLGGVWANESWGRFWGWDPKETWALITFLGYMVIVHLRTAGKLDNFWLAVSSILGFILVLMTWYGVNFILGQGLHSYGSGAGGMAWVIVYLVFELAFICFVCVKKHGKG